MKSKQDLKSFFENGDRPNQEQFWELIESYFHKDEPITLEELSMLKANLATIDKTSDGKETLGNVDTKEQVNTKINAAINALKANAPETYDTLKEIADYIANDSNAEAALLQLINTKINKPTIFASYPSTSHKFIPVIDSTGDAKKLSLSTILDPKLDKPTMTNNYYGLWDDTNKKFINGSIYKNGSNTYISDKLYTPSGINSKDLSFTLQTNITPTPNTLVPKTDGSGLMWYDNNSVGKELGGSGLKYFAENTSPPSTSPIASGIGSIAIGNGAKSLSNNMFVYGNNAGNGATNASNSNFLGSYAGFGATDATNSNFLGVSAGDGATDATNSNFLGIYAGFGATNASNSNFLGLSAGYLATDATNSNFLGVSAGYLATDATNSNFLGIYAGYGATNASYSNFLGLSAGFGATNASYSNFLGTDAGNRATNASNSNLFGYNSGRSFTGNNIGSNNIVIGTNISLGNSVSNSMNIGGVLFGTGFQSDVTGEPKITPTTNGKIGIGVTNPSEKLEVNGDIKADSYKFKLPTTITPQPNMLIPKTDGSGLMWYDNNSVGKELGGSGLKYFAENTSPPSTSPIASGIGSIAIGNGAQALSSHMFVYGTNAGSGATYAYNSNFLGSGAGNGATNASDSNFFGSGAGNGATGAYNSNFFGSGAGNGATYTSNSNLFGYNAGGGATNASYSNFLGSGAGYGATNASDSNFFGSGAGNGAINATNSNFLGIYAGNGATNASNSNFLGLSAGRSFTGNNIGSNNIVIGTNISLGNSVSNSMNIGGVLFGTGFQSDVTGDPKITPTTNGKIGIGVTNPSEKLEVAGNIKVLENGSGIILTSPDGTKTAKISIDNSGNLVTILI